MAAALSGGKILVVDDLPDWRDMIGGLLKDAGYDVHVAADADEAMRLLRQQPYHVAIVDLRLDERDENNKEGLVLAERMKEFLPELAILFLTGHADIPAVKYALKPRADRSSIAFDFLEKHEIPHLLQRIEIAFAQAARVNPQLHIEFDPPLNWLTLQHNIDCLQSLSPELARLELTDLLQRLFHTAESITVKPMNNGHSSAAVVLVTPTMYGLAQTDVVVKFNHRRKAEGESANYDRYVENYVGGARRTQRLSSRATAILGGIAYSFVGAEATEFLRLSHAYATQPVERIKTILDNLFKETCHKWYTNTLKPNPLPQSLSAGYKEWLRLDNSKLGAALAEIVERHPTAHLSFTEPRRPTQSELLFADRAIKLASPLALMQSALAYTGPYCFTHGDLHEGNILVDTHLQTWLIDFYHTRPAHPVRDFAMLESAIKFSLQRSDCPAAVLYDWERSLLAVESLTDRPGSKPPLQLDVEMAKATELIWHIRALLSRILPGATVRDYQISLYFHALKGMTLSGKFSERQRLHAVMAAALLAEILQKKMS
ncbi:MAG: response regulator [Chloroflexota bacterium]